MRRIILAVAVMLSLISPLASAFDEHDTKPIVALELMGQKELAGEAMRACQGMIVGKSDPQLGKTDSYRIASQYLQTVGLVLETKNNGKVPQWFIETVHASAGNDTTACASARHGGSGVNEAAPDNGKGMKGEGLVE